MIRLDQPEETQPIQKDSERAASAHIRKPYLAPRLKVHGRIAELTRFGGSLVVDSGGGLGAQP